MGRSRLRRKKQQERAEEGDYLDEVDEDEVQAAKRGRGSSRARAAASARGRRQVSTSTSRSTKSDNPVIRYFQETAEELRKVKWPTQEEAIRLTLICLGATIAFTIFLGGIDFLAQQVVIFSLGG